MDFNLPHYTWTPLITWLPRLAVFLALGLLLTTDDAGAQQPNPTPVTLETATPAAIATPAEVDTYTLDLSGAPGPTDVAIYTSGGLDTRGTLLGAPTSPPATNDDSDLAGGSPDFYIVRRLEPESYQIDVMGDGQATGAYTLHVEEITEEIPGQAGVTGTIAPGDAVDWYKIDRSSRTGDSDVVVYTSGALDTIGWLLASNGAVLDDSDDHDLTGGEHNFSLGASLGPGIFYVAVRADQDAAGEYTLYAETFSDAAGNPGTTAALTPGVGSIGLIAPGDDFDWYKLDMTGAADVWVYTSGALDTRGFLRDSNGNVLEANDDSELSDGIRNFFIGTHLDAGVYYVAVASYQTDIGPYKLHAELKTDLGDSTSTAVDLALDTPQTGIIGPAGDIDYFKLDLSSTADIVIYTSGGLDTVGELRDGNYVIIAADDDGDISGGSRNFSVWSMLEAGTYYVKVAGYDGATGPYQLHAEAVSDPPGDTATTAVVALESNRVGVLNPRSDGGDDADWFKLDLTSEASSTDVIIQTDGPVDTVGRLLDSDGAELADNDDGGPGRNFLIGASLTPGVYYVEVAGYHDGATGPYRVEAHALDDHGDTPGTASGLPLGSGGRDGVVGPAGDSDLFGFRVPSTTEVWLYTTGDVDTQGRLYQYDSSLELLDFNDDGGRGTNFFIQRTLEPGICFIEVMGWEDETGYYGIYNRIPDSPGDSVTSAQWVELGQIKLGKIDEPGDEDYFRLDLAERTNLRNSSE